MTGRFKTPLTLPAAGKYQVSGPFSVEKDEDGQTDIDAAVVHFILVQGEGAATVLARGQGTWKEGEEEWHGELDVSAGRLPDGKSQGWFRPGEGARGIGLAIAVKRGTVTDDDVFDPPSFQALTWCANFRFDGVVASAAP